ncbi:16S rRNA (guanine(966)-N(2))-methyltransferase RsmD [Myxacorys almedinensis]|uniref:16S rRNA (Guanine(966)-N(2))-methyltransferase RsmD n=1 Tax=Myxacorys almedinensis A TaxID=2690445 RepID=A0A8J7Z7G6_9CYAN|nr:16S rRNA (guanine(966)-N(2))-methyltransferase RsmD [Myxacorys almedinensis]NDJ16920.1 16S rRNA (guanine(966)-N(2))-methyltransferase RsmD [Myxacorys almedinensis A]
MSVRIYGNRLLHTLPGQETRPTLARVREALFNIWQGTIEGCRWLDLCAGSGSMGAEALCRGAAIAVGIEQSSRACAIVEQNWRQIAKPDQAFQVLRGDVVKRLVSLSGQTFDRIYFDPPYASKLYEPVLSAIAQFGLLAPDGELAIEQGSSHSEFEVGGLEMIRQKQYGKTTLRFYRQHKV